MQPTPRRSTFPALLSGLLLVMAACGPVTETEPTSSTEPLGTQQSAMCIGLSVTSLTITGVSSYQGDLAGAGTWAVSTGANGVTVEYYVDGVKHDSDEYRGTSGNWYFSRAGQTCGSHMFQVRAWPMVFASDGTASSCSSNPRAANKGFSEACTNSCQNKCGSTSGTGCYCDPSCVNFGDCCPDYQTWCGRSCPDGMCPDGLCCPASGTCSDGSFCSIW